jgi:hypothetical protein
MLRRILDSHPEICCHGEVFAPDHVRGFSGILPESPILTKFLSLRQHDPVAFLEDFVFWADSVKAVGVKIKYSELDLPQWKPVLAAILADRELRVVHLTRRNRLKRLVSHAIAMTTGVNLALKPDEVHAPVIVRLSPEDCIADFVATAQAEARFRAVFSRHCVFEVEYEDLIRANCTALDELQRFLGVKPTALKPDTIKLNRDNLRDLLDNYDQLEAAFRNSPYAEYLDGDRHHERAGGSKNSTLGNGL